MMERSSTQIAKSGLKIQCNSHLQSDVILYKTRKNNSRMRMEPQKTTHIQNKMGRRIY